MSGYAEDSLFEDYALSRGVAFLEKPFTPSSLAQKVRQILDGPRTAVEPPASTAVRAGEAAVGNPGGGPIG
jgi:hypothetical protein